MKSKRNTAMIGNAHLDPSWMWAWQEGSCEAKASIRSALDRMNEFDDFYFVCSSASVYKWIEEFDPDMFEEMRQRVKEGRFLIVGGWYVQPDCNLPSGEGFVRQALYSQRYFYNKFGQTAKCGYCVDSFGHAATLPQILKKSGMDYYVYMRPSPQEMPKEESIFYWEAPDSSKVLTYRIPETYCMLFEDMKTLEAAVERVNNLIKEKDFMMFYGVGNHGGGPTVKNINLIHKYESDKNELYIENLHNFFEKYPLIHSDIPVYSGELQHHASGAYSAVSEIKTAVRRAETSLVAAESFAIMAYKLSGKEYCPTNFENAWNNVCFTHFHDIFGGCCTKSAYNEAIPLCMEAISFAKKNINTSLQTLSWKIDTSNAPATPVIVFNPYAWEAECTLRINGEFESAVDCNGNDVMTQKILSETESCYERADTLLQAKVSPLGYTTYYLSNEKEINTKNFEVKSDGKSLENQLVKVYFDDKTASVCSYVDKKTNREILADGGIRALVIDENEHDTWSHGKNYFDKVVGKFENGEITVLENGPLRAGIKMVSRYGNSVLTQRFYLENHSPELKMECEILWLEKNKMLKIAANTTLNKCSADYHIPFGNIVRPSNGEEEPGQMWTAIEGEDGTLAVFNDCKYSSSAKDSTLYLTALRSPIYGDHGKNRTTESIYTDQGFTSFTYVFRYYDSPDRAHMTKRSAIMNFPPVTIMENRHKGTLPPKYSGILSEPDNIIITAIKRSEDNDGDVIRAYECAGKECDEAINMPFDNKINKIKFMPYEIKTFIKKDDSECLKEIMMTEFELPLS